MSTWEVFLDLWDIFPKAIKASEAIKLFCLVCGLFETKLDGYKAAIYERNYGHIHVYVTEKEDSPRKCTK